MDKIDVMDAIHNIDKQFEPAITTPFDEYDVPDVTMREIHADLDGFLVGQYATKKAVSQIIWSTFGNLGASTNLIIGRTGCGKSSLWYRLSRDYEDGTIVFCDAEKLTPEGYKGDYKISGIMYGIPNDGKPHILVLDEFDKIILKQSADYDYHRIIQSELLPLFEHADTEYLTIVCLGAFDYIYEQKAKNKKHGIGFASGDVDADDSIQITAQDLIDAGYMRELIGRIDRIVQMDDMTDKMMHEIVDVMRQSYADQLHMDIKIPAHKMIQIARNAIDESLGARGIRSHLRCMIEDYIYDHPSCTCIDLSDCTAAEM